MPWELIVIVIVIFSIALLVMIVKKMPKFSAFLEPEYPYRKKQNFFTASEREFLRALNEVIDKEKYVIFPKVRLADFLEVTERGKEYHGWLSKIKSKHVDFLVWSVEKSSIVLAIEVDGKSHNTVKMIERDEFVEKVYKEVGIPLERVRVGSNFQERAEEIKQRLLELEP